MRKFAAFVANVPTRNAITIFVARNGNLPNFAETRLLCRPQKFLGRVESVSHCIFCQARCARGLLKVTSGTKEFYQLERQMLRPCVLITVNDPVFVGIFGWFERKLTYPKTVTRYPIRGK